MSDEMKVERPERSAKVQAAYAMIHNLCKPRFAEGHRDWIMRIPAEPNYDPDLVISAGLQDLEAQLAAEKAKVEEYARKLAMIFDQGVYSDSLGVEGSDFQVCRWCGGGSGPGGTVPFFHNEGCLLDDDALEKKVAEVWEEVPELRQELAVAESTISVQAGEIERYRKRWQKSAGKVCDLADTVRLLMASAVPNPRDHPTMTKAWAEAEKMLATHDPKPGELRKELGG